MHDARLYLRLLGTALHVQWQYRLNAIIRMVSHFLLTFIDFLGIWILVGRFGPLAGWSLHELAVLYGITNTGFALAQTIARGFTNFDGLLRHGDLDRLLLRPRRTVLLILGRDLPLHQFGRLLQGLGVLCWGLWQQEAITPTTGLLLAWSIVGGACLYAGLAVFQATTAFWTIEGLEVFNVATYGGCMAASYPASCYRPGLRAMLFIIPVALVSYPPCLWVLDRHGEAGWTTAACWAAPAAGIAVLLLASRAWRLGLRRYASTGS